MRISSRFTHFWIIGAAISIASCAATLPEPPVVLNNPVGSNRTAVTSSAGDVSSRGQPVAEAASGSVYNSGAVGSSVEIGIEILHKASYNPFELDNGKSFRTLQTLDVYRSELARHSIETPKEVDFNTQQVLVSSAGEKPTGGYAITVTKIQDTGSSVIVTVVQSMPGPSCINTQGRTFPFEFILVPSTKPIQIFERQKVENCQ